MKTDTNSASVPDPQVTATLRNTGISLLRLAGWTNITAGLRHHARDSRRPIKLLAESRPDFAEAGSVR